MQRQNPEKNVLPVQVVSQTGKTKDELKSENKKLSSFCEFCSPVSFHARKDPDVFTDKYGFAWRCGDPLRCPHAVTMGPVITDCMVLNRVYTCPMGSLQDLLGAKSNQRRKNRVHMAKELDLIRGIRMVG